MPRARPTPDKSPSGVRAPGDSAAAFLEAVNRGVLTEPVEEAVLGVLATALTYEQSLSFGVRLGEPWEGGRFVVCSAELQLAGDLVLGAGGRLFPRCRWERAESVDPDTSASLIFASDQGEPHDFAHLARDVRGCVRSVLCAARARRDLARAEAELATLRAQLLHSDRLAALGQLSASIVHELSNPLTAVLAYSAHIAKKAQGGALEEADKERLERMHEAAQRLQDFVRQLAGWSRPGGAEVGMVRVEDAVEQALSFCEHAIERSGSRVVRSFGGAPPVLGSFRELTQVFVNLLTNAAQSMPGGGRIEICTRVEGRFTVAEVRDDGPGIHPSHLPHLFDAFFTTKGPDVGTGLGLNIVRRIVQSHGGEVSADEGAGGGAVFTVRFPVEAPHPPILSTTPPPASEERGKKRSE